VLYCTKVSHGFPQALSTEFVAPLKIIPTHPTESCTEMSAYSTDDENNMKYGMRGWQPSPPAYRMEITSPLDNRSIPRAKDYLKFHVRSNLKGCVCLLPIVVDTKFRTYIMLYMCVGRAVEVWGTRVFQSLGSCCLDDDPSRSIAVV